MDPEHLPQFIVPLQFRAITDPKPVRCLAVGQLLLLVEPALYLEVANLNAFDAALIEVVFKLCPSDFGSGHTRTQQGHG